MPFKRSLNLLFSDVNFIFLLLGFTFSYGFFNLYGTILSELLKLYKFSEELNSLIGSLAIGLGLISGIIFSLVTDYFKKYRKFILMLNFCAIISFFLFSLYLEFQNDDKFLITSLWCFVFVCNIPATILNYDFACELTYPAGESLTLGLILSSANIFGIISVKLNFNN